MDIEVHAPEWVKYDDNSEFIIEDDFNDLNVTLLDGITELEAEEEQISTENLRAKQKSTETRKVNSNKMGLKKGPLWQYRTNYEDDDKFS